MAMPSLCCWCIVGCWLLVDTRDARGLVFCRPASCLFLVSKVMGELVGMMVGDAR